MKATLIRVYGSRVTRGTLHCVAKGKKMQIKTIELPWANNEKGASCIPVGIYEVVYAYSPRLKKKTYRVVDVPSRDGILFHPANFAKQLKGCIAPCKAFADLDNDGVIDGTNSRLAVEELENFFEKNGFTLEIK